MYIYIIHKGSAAGENIIINKKQNINNNIITITIAQKMRAVYLIYAERERNNNRKQPP